MIRHKLKYILLFLALLLLSGCGSLLKKAEERAEDMNDAKQPLEEEIEIEVDPSLPVPVLTGTGIDTGKGVDLYWTPAEGADTYEIQTGLDGNFQETRIFSPEDGEEGHFLAEGLEEGKEYAFRIRTRIVKEGRALRSEWSEPLHQTMYEALVDEDVAAPFDVTYLMAKGEGLCIQWKKPEYCTGFELFRSYTGTGSWERLSGDIEAGKPSRVQYDDREFDPSVSPVYYMVRTVLEEDGVRKVSPFAEVITAAYQEELTLNLRQAAIPSGESLQLTALHGWGAGEDITWYAGKTKVVTVDEKGLATGVGRGAARIDASLPDGSQTASMTLIVDRKNPEPLKKDYKQPFAYLKDRKIYEKKTVSEKDRAVVLVTGDLMAMKNQMNAAWSDENGYNFNASFSYVKDLIRSADLAAGNLETLVSSAWSYCSEISSHDGRPVCNTTPRYLDALKDAGFDLLTMSNNHNADWGTGAAGDTVANADRYGFMHTGLYRSGKEDRTLCVSVNGIRIGFLAYDGGGLGFNHKEETWSREDIDTILNAYSRERAAADIEALKKKGAEYIIVCMHWGTINNSAYNEKQEMAAQELADLGADYIAGSHPHLIQKYRLLTAADGRKVPCIYCMGNFMTSLNSLEGQRDSVLMRLALKRNGEGKVVLEEDTYIPCHIFRQMGEASYAVVPLTKELSPDLDSETRDQLLKRIGESIGSEISAYQP
ncbi:MAG: CapA family protein [Lachnospiraceae bacterium]|nr:CapA family protein [Lachnospiraceae bacterium]